MNKKNWLLVLLAFVFTVTTFSSCKKSDSDTDKSDEWFQKAAFKGPVTSSAASFLINNIAYITTGATTNAAGKTAYIKDTYAYDAASDTWSEKAGFPGEARIGAVGFAIGNVGYVGAGNNGTDNLSDFYKFDMSSNTWTQIASLPIAVNGAVAFTVNGVGYVGTGSTTTASSGKKNTTAFYKYNASSNTWETIADIPYTEKPNAAFSFVVNNVAYVGGGSTAGGAAIKDFYKFDPSKENPWTKLNDLNRSDDSYTYSLARSNASAFVINGTPFVVGGSNGSVINTTWKYNVGGDYWTNDNGVFAGPARKDAIGFAVGNNGYITTGINGSSTRYDDTWMFTPIY